MREEISVKFPVKRISKAEYDLMVNTSAKLKPGVFTSTVELPPPLLKVTGLIGMVDGVLLIDDRHNG